MYCIWSIITAYAPAPSGLKVEETNLSVLYMNLWRKEGQTPTGRCKAEFSGAIAVSYKDDIMNLIGVQNGSGSADMRMFLGWLLIYALRIQYTLTL